MFCLPNNIIKKIINRELSYEEISKDGRNELSKEKNLEAQAAVNSLLEKNYSAVCSVLEEACKKENCILFKKVFWEVKSSGVCKEYKIDFPDAEFDLKYHVALVGTDRVDIESSIENLKELKKQGAEYYCVSCGKVYKKKKNELYRNNLNKIIKICSCEDFLFKDIDFFIDFLDKKLLH